MNSIVNISLEGKQAKQWALLLKVKLNSACFLSLNVTSKYCSNDQVSANYQEIVKYSTLNHLIDLRRRKKLKSQMHYGAPRYIQNFSSLRLEHMVTESLIIVLRVMVYF